MILTVIRIMDSVFKERLLNGHYLVELGYDTW